MVFPFLDLPPEIRERIYLFTCISNEPIPLSSDGDTYLFDSEERLLHIKHPSFPLNLILTCHQLYHEVRPLYFANNSFSLLVHKRPDAFQYFLEPGFRDYRRQIRSLRLVLLRWGKHNFFTNTLAPLIEDMILNGNLRELEVLCRHANFSHLTHTGYSDCGLVRFGTTLELSPMGHVQRLKEILEDPYLEYISVRAYLPSLLGADMEVMNVEYEDISYLFTKRQHAVQ
jgi:hypothetical protein